MDFFDEPASLAHRQRMSFVVFLLQPWPGRKLPVPPSLILARLPCHARTSRRSAWKSPPRFTLMPVLPDSSPETRYVRQLGIAQGFEASTAMLVRMLGGFPVQIKITGFNLNSIIALPRSRQ